jgi:hypothetical protein
MRIAEPGIIFRYGVGYLVYHTANMVGIASGGVFLRGSSAFIKSVMYSYLALVRLPRRSNSKELEREEAAYQVWNYSAAYRSEELLASTNRSS